MSVSAPKGPIRRLGSYSAPQPHSERRPAVVIKYQGQRAHIRFHNGMTYAMPAQPLLEKNISEGGAFMLVTDWIGKTPVASRVELMPEARPALARMQEPPKVVVRDGRKMITRKRPPG